MKEVTPCPIGLCLYGQKTRAGKSATIKECMLHAYVKGGNDTEIVHTLGLLETRCPFGKRLRRAYEKSKK